MRIDSRKLQAYRLILIIGTLCYRLDQIHNLHSSRKYVWVIEYWDLGFICNLVLEICIFI